eukprot:9323774-Pyramimonas_sp.AAC.1
MEFEVLAMVILKKLLRDDTPIWRSANDIIIASGNNGRIPPCRTVQLIGIKPNSVQCKYDRVGQVRVHGLHTEDNHR